MDSMAMDMRLLVIPVIIVVLAAVAFIASQPAPVAPVSPPTQPPATPPATEAVAVAVTSAPITVETGKAFQVSWTVNGTGTVTHSAVHYDYSSHPGTFGTDVAPAASGYPYFPKDYAAINMSAPASFTVSITPNVTGALYFRAHAIVDGKQYWTDEMALTVTVAPAVQETRVVITSAPATAESGKPFQISWGVEGPAETITHTAVHYDYATHPGTFGETTAPAASGYPYFPKDFAAINMTAPRGFAANITPNMTGTLYFRGHAIVGGKHYWTDEMTMAVVAPAPQAQPREFAIEADDYGFYLGGMDVSSVSVNGGDSVRITFSVRTTGVYYGGLQFNGCGQGTGAVRPGNSAMMQFTSSSTCTITSYWPNSGVVKDSMQVIVQ